MFKVVSINSTIVHQKLLSFQKFHLCSKYQLHFAQHSFFCIVSSWTLDSYWPKFYLYIILIHLETILSSLLEKCARNRFPQELHYNCPPKLAAGERYICFLSNNARHRSDSRSADLNSFTAAKWAFKLLHRVAHFIYLHSSIHQYILVYIDIYLYISTYSNI